MLIDLAVQATGANGNGLDAVRHIRDAESELPIVAIVESDSQGELALSAGAQDFVLKDGVDGVGMGARHPSCDPARARGALLARVGGAALSER